MSKENNPKTDPTSLHERDKAYKAVVRSSPGNKRAAVRAYVQGNKWATENAKNTGNW